MYDGEVSLAEFAETWARDDEREATAIGLARRKSAKWPSNFERGNYYRDRGRASAARQREAGGHGT